MKILVGPSDQETDEAFNELAPDDALFWSIEGNLLEYVKKAIDKGAHINSIKDGWIALLYASANGYLDIVTYLIEIGADINVQENYGNTALIYASIYNQLNVVDQL